MRKAGCLIASCPTTKVNKLLSLYYSNDRAKPECQSQEAQASFGWNLLLLLAIFLSKKSLLAFNLSLRLAQVCSNDKDAVMICADGYLWLK